jgi:hypothetical protein
MLPTVVQPKPKPRLATSGSIPDLLSSGSSAPQGVLSQEAMRNDVASLTLASSPAKPAEVAVVELSPRQPSYVRFQDRSAPLFLAVELILLPLWPIPPCSDQARHRPKTRTTISPTLTCCDDANGIARHASSTCCDDANGIARHASSSARRRALHAGSIGCAAGGCPHFSARRSRIGGRRAPFQ